MKKMKPDSALIEKLLAEGNLLKFKGNVKPVHEGWYYAFYEKGRFRWMYRWHDGEWWHDYSLDKEIYLMPAGKPDFWFGIAKT